jgi:hypothetical protein
MEGILADRDLRARISRGARQGKERKGRFVKKGDGYK